MKKTTKEKFEDKIFYSPDGCWLWTGYTTKLNYGEVIINYKKVRTHRASYMIYKGEIPEGIFVCHHCDNPLCVNPDHLFLGTQLDNMRDMIKKGRRVIATSEKKSKKINRDDATFIVSMKGIIPSMELAKKYNMSQSSISRIQRGDRWTRLNPNSK